MLVTELKKIDEKRHCLYLDYEPFGPVYKSDIRRLKLTVGEECDKELIMAFRKDLFFQRAMNKAVASIKYAEKCEYDIRKKLRDICYDEEVVDTTVSKLEEYGYIDDSRFATLYIRSHMNSKSHKELRYALSMKRIPEEVIAAAFEACDVPDEREVLRGIISKKYSRQALLERREKVTAAMCRKGYSCKDIQRSIQSLLDE